MASPCAQFAEECSGEEAELLCLGDDGAAAQDVVVLRGDAVEDGFAAFAEEVEGDGEFFVDMGADGAALAEHVAGADDEVLASWRGTRG